MRQIDDKTLEVQVQRFADASPGIGIAIDGLTKNFDQRQVLRGVALDIRPGEFVAIVGRSGCGKSTLLRLLTALDQPTHGSIAFDGKPLERRHEASRIMFQDARLLPWKSVLQNVTLGLEGERNEVAQRGIEALHQVGLGDRAKEWPGKLSGGQRQRVALARALVHRPRLLLLDEPLGALDALTRIEMQRLIESLWRQHQFTAVLVTHDVAEAVALGDRVILIEDGRIVLDQPVPLLRPREHGEAELAQIEGRVLKRLMTVDSLAARNQIRGHVAAINADDVIAEIEVDTPHGVVFATIDRRSLRDTPLEVGAEVLASFKSTEVALAKTHC